MDFIEVGPPLIKWARFSKRCRPPNYCCIDARRQCAPRTFHQMSQATPANCPEMQPRADHWGPQTPARALGLKGPLTLQVADDEVIELQIGECPSTPSPPAARRGYAHRRQAMSRS